MISQKLLDRLGPEQAAIALVEDERRERHQRESIDESGKNARAVITETSSMITGQGDRRSSSCLSAFEYSLQGLEF